MEGAYACNLNNRFELFLDEENDPLEAIAKAEQQAAARGKAGDKKDNKKDAAKKKGLSKTLVESVKTIAAAVDQPARPLGRRNADGPPPTALPRGDGAAPRGDGPGPRGPRRDGPPRDRDNMERRNNERNFEQRPEGDRLPRGNGGGYRGDRGGEGGQRGPRREGGGVMREGGGGRGGGYGGGRREFDRRSGDVRSGVKSVEKRQGQGSYNWGNAQADAQHEQQGGAAGEDQANVSQEIRNPEGDQPEVAEADAVPAEPEVVEMTLEQWKKEQAAKKKTQEYAAQIRKPNEGEKDDPKLKKAVVLKKKKTNESDDDDKTDEEEEDEAEKLKKMLEQTLASQFHFADQRNSAGGPMGRGPRGPPRGPPREGGRPPFGGPGGERAPRAFNAHPPHHQRQQHNAAPRVEDLNDFPSLAA